MDELLEMVTIVLQVSTRTSDDVTVVVLQGKATIGANSDLLSRRLRSLAASRARKILLNLADLEQMDSSGIAAILGTHVSLLRQGGSLKLCSPSNRVRDVLEAMKLINILSTFDNEVEALDSFRPLGYSASA